MAPSKSITVNKMEVNMQIPSTVNHCFLVQLLNDVICFLLYQRQQIPEPVQLLKRNYSQNSGDTNGKSKVTKMRTRQDSAFRTQVAKFLESIGNIQQTLSGALQASHVSEILLVLGATPVSAKEVFQIDISRFASYQKSTMISQRMLSLCSRKLCVKLMENDEFFFENIGQSNVHIFIRARKGISIPGWLPWPQFKLPQNKLRLQLTLIPEGGSQQSDVLKIHEDKENISKKLPVKMAASERILSDNTNITEKAGSKSSQVQSLGEKVEKLELCVQKKGEIREKHHEEKRKVLKTEEITFTEETKENVNSIMKVSNLESKKKTSLEERKENSLSEDSGKNTKSEEVSRQSKKIAEKTDQKMQKNSSITEIIKENSHSVVIETHIELKQKTTSENMKSCFVEDSVVSGSQAKQTLPSEVITESIEQTNDLKEKKDEGDTNTAPEGQQEQVMCVNGHAALENIDSHNTIEDSVNDASLTTEQSRTGNNFCSLVIENTDEISKNSSQCLESTNGSNPVPITSTLFKNDEVKDQREQFLESKTGNNLGSLPGNCGYSSTCSEIANTDISYGQNPFCEPRTSSSNVTVISDEVLKSPKESSGPGDQNQSSSHAGENGLIPEATAELSHNSSSKESPLNAESPQTNENNSLNHPLAKFPLSENNLPSHNSSDSCSPNGCLAEKAKAAIISKQGSATISCDTIQSTENSVYKIMNEISTMPKKTSNSSFSNLPKNLKESQSGQGFQEQHFTCREENDSVSDLPQRMNYKLVSRTGDRHPSDFWSDTEGTGSTSSSKTNTTELFPEEISNDEASTHVSTSKASPAFAKSDEFIYFKSSIVIKGFKY